MSASTSKYRFYLVLFVTFCLATSFGMYLVKKNSATILSEADQLLIDFQSKRHTIAQMSEATKTRLLMLVQMYLVDDDLETSDLYNQFLEQGTRFLVARQQLLSTHLTINEQLELQKISDLVDINAPKLRQIASLIIDNGSYYQIEHLLAEELPEQQLISERYNEMINQITQSVKTRQDSLQLQIAKNDQLFMALSASLVIVAILILLIANKNQKSLRKATAIAEKEKMNALEANQEKSRFLANMSHELRTPMHAILSFANLGLKKVDNKKIERYLQNIRTSGIRLTTLLDDLLDLSKLEAGKMRASFQEQDITLLIPDAINELDSLLSRKEITIDINDDDHVECAIDQKLMMQVFINLLSNAIKFSPEQSTVKIRIKTFEGELHKLQQELLEISISDQGVGIPESELETIFDQFVQSSKTRTDAGGTGLGLPITREIIALHFGKIRAISPNHGSDHGTTISIVLPVEPELNMI